MPLTYRPILRWFYSFVFTLSLPCILLRLLYRSIRLPTYRQRWGERLSITLPNFLGKPKPSLWIHGVSVGESLSALPLVEALITQYPDMPIVFTTTTPTASQLVTRLLGNRVIHQYMPYDLSWMMQRFLRAIHCKLCIILESEIWPNHLFTCKKLSVPVLLLNGQLSDRSFKRYQKVPRLASQIFSCYTAIVAPSQQDLQRFKALGYYEAQLKLAPNLKYAAPVQPSVITEGKRLRTQWENPNKKIIWIAASTHDGEEEMILDTFIALKKLGHSLLLLLVPRHPERFDSIFSLCEKYQLNTVRLSENPTLLPQTEVLLGDRLGYLNQWYAASDIAFVGGSLTPVGGHNLLEPAALGLPIVTGMHLESLRETRDIFLAHQALAIVEHSNGLTELLDDWIQHAEKRKSLGENAKAVFLQNHQAALKMPLDVIRYALEIKSDT